MIFDSSPSPLHESASAKGGAKIWIVIPVHNRVATTLRCLRGLQAVGAPSFATILVVDDGSTDGTEGAIREQFPEVRVAKGEGDLWWTGAVKKGTEIAIREGAEYVIWLNDDCLPNAGALETLVAGSTRTGAIYGGICRSSSSGGVTYSGGFMPEVWPQPVLEAPSQSISCDWLHGNLVCIPRRVPLLIGFPDAERLPHNWGDIEYTYRAKVAGVTVILEPAASGVCDPDPGPFCQSWIDPSLRVRDIWLNFFNPKVWWYFPGLRYFMVRYFGLKGAWGLSLLIGKLVFLTFARPLLPGILLRWRANIQSRRLRESRERALAEVKQAKPGSDAGNG